MCLMTCLYEDWLRKKLKTTNKLAEPLERDTERYCWQTQKANLLDLRTVNNCIGGTIFQIVPLLTAVKSVCDCIVGQFGKLSHLIKEFASSIPNYRTTESPPFQAR